MRRHVVTPVIGTAVVVALAGCGTHEGQKIAAPSHSSSTSASQTTPHSSSPSATPSPSSTLSPNERAAKKTFDRFMTAKVKTLNRGTAQGTGLHDVVASKARTHVDQQLLAFKRDGVVSRGKPAVTAEIDKVGTKHGRPAIRLRGCMDNTHWYPTMKKTGKKVKLPKQRHHFPIESLVEKRNGSWFVTQYGTYRTKKC